MKVLFLYVSTNMSRDGDLWYYDEGLATAAAVLRQHGHDAVLRMVSPHHSEAEVAAWVDEQAAGEPRVLLCYLTSIHFSAYGHDQPDTFAQIAGLGERTGHPTMFAGIWATLNADALLERGGVDMVARGELDGTLVEVCHALERGESVANVANIWSRDEATGEVRRNSLRPLENELDALPMPARDLLPFAEQSNERDGILTVLGSRGCPMSCSFCTHVVMRDAYDVRPASYMRYKSIDRLFAEIHAAREALPELWAIYFHDDMFLVRPDLRREFLDRYPREIGMPFGCNLVIGQASESMIAQLAAAGLSHALIGVESGSAALREKVMDKPLCDDEIDAVVARCRRHGVRVKFYAIIGAPDEDRRVLTESIKGFARYGSDMVQVQAWLAHETSSLLERDPEAAKAARRLYEVGAGDRRVRRLKFYFHYYQRYIALYRLLYRERRWPLRRRLMRAAVTASLRLPFAPELLATHDWDGKRRWPSAFRGLARLAFKSFGAPAKWLQKEVVPLEQQLASDYLQPPGVELPAMAKTGWVDGKRLDRRLTATRARIA